MNLSIVRPLLIRAETRPLEVRTQADDAVAEPSRLDYAVEAFGS